MREEFITSVQNPYIKKLYSLHNRKGREETGTYLVEGPHLVEEAIRSGADIRAILYNIEYAMHPDCERALEETGRDLDIYAVSQQIMEKLSETKSPQGIIAVVGMPDRSFATWWKTASERDFLLLILDELQDPGNLGTILRTADAAGVDAVILGQGSVDIYNGKVVRATMGSLFRLPVFVEKLDEVVDEVKSKGGSLLVTALGGESRSYDEPLYSGKTAIVIGNEARGVSQELKQAASQLVHIPLYGRAESLNAAVAAGVMLYEAQRQRKSQ
ncbi:TrmH family RNA methyltransferase [Brevibacillus dissolubilis]|uniref:TrmH family RNA methyltransferase n=1 Tax=Brevibacillus dissolubilis TaxID=1844116 RepID=UPI001115AE23|nr:RNA methyltransferase [Brevibacillus dissolubilis]